MMDENDAFLTPRQKAFLEANPGGTLSDDAPERFKSVELKGVGGWLQFLILALTIFGPLLNAAMTFLEMREIKDSDPAFKTGDQWLVIQMFTWGFFAIYSAISVATGLLLLKRHKRSTIPMVIALIWLIGPMLSFAPSIMSGDLVGGEGRSIVFAVIWTAYLLRSKRVKNTFLAG